MRDYQLGETWAEIEARRTREELAALADAVEEMNA